MDSDVAHIYYLKYFLLVFPDNILYFPIRHYIFPFIMDTDRVLCEIRTKFLSRIYTNFSLRRVNDMCFFIIFYYVMHKFIQQPRTNGNQPNCTRIFSPQKHMSSTYTICDELCHTHYYWVGKPLDHRIFHTRNSHWSVVMIETSNRALSYRNMVTDIA